MTVLTRTDSPTMNEDERLKRDEAAVNRDFWRKFAGLAAQIPFAEDLLTAYYCALDRQHAEPCAGGADRGAALFHLAA